MVFMGRLQLGLFVARFVMISGVVLDGFGFCGLRLAVLWVGFCICDYCAGL